MPSLSSIRQRFVCAIQRSALDPAEAALLIAQEEEQDFEIEDYLGQLDAMGQRARLLLSEVDSRREKIEALNHFLFVREGFRGNEWDYYDPRNSFLNHVIDRRLGIPLTLSLIYMEVGRRAGLDGLAGIGLPGHFMVRSELDGRPLYIDPFNHGQLRNDQECHAYVAARFGAGFAANEELFRPVNAQQMLVRLLRNLKAIYLRRSDIVRALAAVERILIMEPEAPQEVRDRGLLRLRRGDLLHGLNDLERYGALAPQALDLEDIRRQAEGIAGFLAPRN